VMLLAEYESSVQVRNPPKREAQASVVDQAPRSVQQREIRDSDLPDYNESRARSEYERANLLELERKQKEGLLLPAEQVEKVWANSVTIARTKLLGVPTRLRQRIPHLTLEEIAIAEELIRESLEELAGGEGDGE
jgi:phage terminase Nu1 subunit (DNA packaging protein)